MADKGSIDEILDGLGHPDVSAQLVRVRQRTMRMSAALSVAGSLSVFSW